MALGLAGLKVKFSGDLVLGIFLQACRNTKFHVLFIRSEVAASHTPSALCSPEAVVEISLWMFKRVLETRV